jgi:hypothetical protein
MAPNYQHPKPSKPTGQENKYTTNPNWSAKFYGFHRISEVTTIKEAETRERLSDTF